MIKKLRNFALVVFTLMAVAVLATAIGSVPISFKKVLGMIFSSILGFKDIVAPNWSKAHEVIVLQIRLPRVLLALLVGAGLSVSGVLFQGTLRNPLADPYIIGVSSGASLGATLGLLFFIPRGIVGFNTLPVFAFVGALLTTIAVSRIGRRGGRLEPTSLLLAGVAIGSFLTALVSLFMVLQIQNLQDVYLWLMGSLSGRGWKHFWVILPYVFTGIVVSVWLARDLNLYLLGEETAHSLGVNVHNLQRIVLAVGSLMAASCVAVTGVIGFVGLMVPHALRLILGAEHKRLIFHSVWVGALFLLLADTLARTLFTPIELPVGIITAFVGGPFFIYLLKRGSSFYE